MSQILSNGSANPPTPSAVVYDYKSVNFAISPYTVQPTDVYISVDATGGPVIILLPNSTTTGRILIVKDRSGIAATNNITVTTVSGLVGIDGLTTFVMNTAYESIEVIFNSINYEVF